jgi:predicted nuclease of predicted toxin-antitoxin system
MKLLIDMNLSPQWKAVLERHGWVAQHWSTVGDPKATDLAIMQWARDNGYAVLTHDLDFGAALVATRGEGPSVIQVRTQDVLPAHMESLLVRVLKEYETAIETGALVVVDEDRLRVRFLPLAR